MMAIGWRNPGRGVRFCAAAFGLLLASAAEANAQIPGMPAAAAGPTPAKKGSPAKKEGGETVTAVSGPIKAEDNLFKDKRIELYLEGLLRQVPGVRKADASVTKGVALIDGQVDDDDTRNQITDIAGKVEGLSLVINRLTTDAEVLTAPELLKEKVAAICGLVKRRWLLGVLAVGVVLASMMLARVFNAQAETLLAPFVKNVMLRSVAGSLIGSGIVLGGLVFALSILNLTHAVLSVLGLASIAGLAVGFAFKDITENFIASVLLGVRRPFQVGDYVTVAGQTGVVRSLNTRATVLVTLEGNHIRIPNNVVYKEILINATASPSYRVNFDVVVPYEASAAAAVEAMTAALHRVDGVLHDPPARALVEALEPGGVRLKAYYWVAVQGTDWAKVNSDAKLQVKVALQQAHVLTAPAAESDVAATAAAAPHVTPAVPAGGRLGEPIRVDYASRAESNLRKDAHAAEAARTAPTGGQPTPVERALNQAETRVSDEGANLLATAGRSDG